MTTLKRLIAFILFFLAAPCFANMVISNAPKAAAGGGGGSGSITKVQSTGNRNGSGALALSLTDVGANRLITAEGGHGAATNPTSVVDNRGHTFTAAKIQIGNSLSSWVYYYVTTAAYSGTYTVTITPNGGAVTASVAEWQSNLNAFTLDVTTGTTGSGTTYSTGASATTHADSSLAIGAFVNNSGSNTAITSPAGWGLLFEEQNGVSWLVGGSNFSTSTVAGVSLNPQWVNANTTWATALAVFK